VTEAQKLLLVEDVAQLLRVPRRRVYELARAGLMPAVHLGKQVRFPEDKLRAWIDAGGVRTTLNHRDGDKT
jgi:excisionase family DNA binding protein